jgi:carbamoyltransferase
VDGEVQFAAEEERFSRSKHAHGEFPSNAVDACLDHCSLSLPDVDTVAIPWDMSLQSRRFEADVERRLSVSESTLEDYVRLEQTFRQQTAAQFYEEQILEDRLAKIEEPVPPVETHSHHRCHAASAFYPSGYDEALVVTVDAFGEYDSTVVWLADDSGLQRLRTYEFPNSLGILYSLVTQYLGYTRESKSEGKVMGLAAYGGPNDDIRSTLDSAIETGVDYDVTPLTTARPPRGVAVLEELFDRPRKDEPTDFTAWERDLAYEVQQVLEETIVAIVEEYAAAHDVSNVALAGGVALNCKMNKRVMESSAVEDLFIQPVAHDAGISLGAAMLEFEPEAVPAMSHVYWGSGWDGDEVTAVLDGAKVAYSRPDDLERYVAERLADGALVGWFQGRTEMGPRALGNRSILADPRDESARDAVNRHVKHRAEWRPFAPSMLAERASEYLENYEPSPYMIKTFDATDVAEREIPAVLHPSDATTRPQTVERDANPRYHRLLEEFARETGVPVLLNTSFNVSGEPIVDSPTDALQDFYATGLDLLVMDDYVVEKSAEYR